MATNGDEAATSRRERARLPRWAKWAIGGLAVAVVAGSVGYLAGYHVAEDKYRPKVIDVRLQCQVGQRVVGAYMKYLTPDGQTGKLVTSNLEYIPGHPNQAELVVQPPAEASHYSPSAGCDEVPGDLGEPEWAHNDPTQYPDGRTRWLLTDGTHIVFNCSDPPNKPGRPGTNTRNGRCEPEPSNGTSVMILHLPQARDAIPNRQIVAEQQPQPVPIAV
jgi:hypothetical protein